MSKPWIAGFEAGGAWLARDLGLEPVGQVIGNGVFTPIVAGIPATSMEVSSDSKLATTGWTSALDRLVAGAKALGADGVLDIRLGQRVVDASTGTTEFSGIGTAVRGLRRAEVWSTSLGPEDLSVLLRTGFAPLRYVVGCCTWHQSVYPWRPKYVEGLGRSMGLMQNQEFVPGTKATYTARAIALQRMDGAAMEAGAAGIVAVDLRWNRMSGIISEGATCGCEAFGTAIVPARGGEDLCVNCAVPMRDA